MTEKEFEAGCLAVRNELGPYAYKHSTSILRVDNHDVGHALGTGNYLVFEGVPYLMTNHHVVRDSKGQPMMHLPDRLESYQCIEGAFLTDPYPVDIGINRISKPWVSKTKQCLMDKFDTHWHPSPREILLIVGYPGTTAERTGPAMGKSIRTYFEGIDLSAVPFLVQQIENWTPGPEFKSDFHFAVGFPEQGKLGAQVLPRKFPNPAGISGSLVWDSKFVACGIAGKPWNIEEAKICGVIWEDDYKTDVLLGTKIEIIMSTIKRLHDKHGEAIAKFKIYPPETRSRQIPDEH